MLVTKQPVLRRFWYAIMPMAKLEAGPQPFTLLGEDIVLWKQADGTPAAVRDRCCHRTAKLSKGFVTEAGHLACGYHGWQYDCSGACVKIPQQPDTQIPAGAKVPAYHCAERFGYAWVALDDPLLPLLEAEEEALGQRRIHQFDETWRTGALRLMENSFDSAHFAFVHKGTFGQGDHPKPEHFKLDETEYGFEASMVITINNPPESHRITGTTEPTTQRIFSNQWHLPFLRKLGLRYPSGIHHTIYTSATPIDDERIQVIQWLYRNDTEADCPAEILNDWDTRVVLEDKVILESVNPDAPVDVARRDEAGMASDRPGMIMRRRLLELLQAHGETEQHRWIRIQPAKEVA